MWFWDWNRLYQYKPLFFCHCLIAFLIYLEKMIYCLCNLANIYVFVVSLLFWYTVVIVLGTLHLSWFVLLVTEQSDNYYSWVMHEITEVVVFEYSILVNYLCIAGNSFQTIKLWNWYFTRREWWSFPRRTRKDIEIMHYFPYDRLLVNCTQNMYLAA